MSLLIGVAVLVVFAWIFLLMCSWIFKVVAHFLFRLKPYRIVGHCFDTGMVKVCWRDEPDHTYTYTPARLASLEQGRAVR
ncbi:hypothetical protein [Nonomuraea sp. NPDC049141]|uniref:hypothetical protein n=1 Tax=Nonomuraea sp. NPDC049141 TaxID=3155500 RepID=UPI00341100E9